jgi:hypothetical protein
MFCPKVGELLYRRRAFHDLGSLAEASRPREQVEHLIRACTQVLFVRKAELNFFFLFRNSERLAGTFCSSEDPNIAWLVPSTAEDPTAENRFLQAGKGAENTKEKSRQCFTLWEFSKRVFQFLLSFVAYCKKIATKGTLCNLTCPCFVDK